VFFAALAGFCLLCQTCLAAPRSPLAAPRSPIAEPAAPPAGASAPRFALTPVNPALTSYLRMGRLDRLRSRLGQQGLGLMPSPIDFSYLRGASRAVDAAVYPGSYDLRTLGKVGPVEDQGDTGTCWAFASFGSLESALLPADPESFSEDNLALNSGFDYDPYDGGGNSLMATAYLARWAGPVAAAQDAFDDGITPPGLTADKHVQEALYLPSRVNALDDGAIKSAVMDYGAVYTGMFADDGMEGSTTSAAYNAAKYAYCYTGSDQPNHAVDIVGWNDAYPAADFSSRPPGNGAFIVRNSWGSNWGDKGYFYVSYYDACIGYQQSPACEDDANTVFDDAEPITNFSDIYQYDPLGWTDTLGYSSDTAWFANHFTARTSDQLSAVSFYAAEPGSSYTLFASVGSSPVLTAAGSGSLPTAGYHTVALSSPVQLAGGQGFVVAVELTTPGYDAPIPLETCIDGYSSGATAAPGESFVSPDGVTWTDLTSDADSADDNVCLKAFTRDSQAPPSDVTAPTTTVIPANRYELNYWNNTACHFTFTAIDNMGGSGIADTQTRLDKGNWMAWGRGTVFTVTAPADHADDGRHVFLVRSTDVAGNVAIAKTFSLAIDTRRPSSQTPAAALVRRGSFATVRFRVLDARPSAGCCRVVIVVKSMTGRQELTFSPSPWYKTGSLVSYRFRCRLPRGRYRFFVTAWDGAGNRSAKPACNHLTVS
jgi:C1A family cysteine protease